MNQIKPQARINEEGKKEGKSSPFTKDSTFSQAWTAVGGFLDGSDSNTQAQTFEQQAANLGKQFRAVSGSNSGFLRGWTAGNFCWDHWTAGRWPWTTVLSGLEEKTASASIQEFLDIK
ncbi:hypothetical protein MA16_Dca016195 [Dendrobium catenatum]|uniref:Uncharacterized protein n=1 Tax=Dendrobium catenatum TaxID=906689 RepID=A0A2I0WBU5_9ASPA|nr:hypothetical protein MA16_Dca016195 [Dendrobium catenatum]